MSTLRYIAVHHTGGTLANVKASTQHQKAEDIDAYHKVKWNFRSNINKYGGYNFFIDVNGLVTQFREVGEETAAQFGHNKDTVSICLAGNFLEGCKDEPTTAQKSSLVSLIDDLFFYQDYGMRASKWAYAVSVKLELSDMRIVPHRHLSQTTCYGSKLSDAWARELFLSVKDIPTLYKLITDLCYKIIQLVDRLSKTKTAASIHDRSCEGHLSI